VNNIGATLKTVAVGATRGDIWDDAGLDVAIREEREEIIALALCAERYAQTVAGGEELCGDVATEEARCTGELEADLLALINPASGWTPCV